MTLTNNLKEVKFERKILRETKVPDTGVLIAAPSGKAGLNYAKKIQKRFLNIGCSADILHDPKHNILKESDRPIIAMGNLANSKCVKYMYYKFLCITDKSYPGKEGVNLRTIIDPFATGFNIIHIGYSDDTGLEKAVNAFLKRINNPIPYINKISYTKLPYDEEYINSIKEESLPEKIDLIPSSGASRWWLKGFVSYVTGDMKPFETYLEGWRKMIKLSKANDYLIINTHLYMAQHMESWRFLEYAGMIPDELRGQIEKCIFDWAESSQGMGYAGAHTGEKNLPSHNHTMFCGLSLLYASDYFSKRYPKLKQPEKWEKTADDVFYTFNNNGWKPYCDDSSYSNRVSLPLVCMYSIFKDSHIFLDTSGKKAADWVKAVIGQNGIMPSFGDGSIKSPFPTSLARLFAHYYNDGEMQYLLNRFKGKKYTLGIGCNRLFDSKVKPVEPKQSGVISLIPMDRYIYDVWDKNEKQGKRLTMTPPKGPYEKCFDKVSVRTGPDEKEDDFLLIDGLGSNGIHSYSDAMGVLDYTSKGIVWLVEENCYRWPEPENCSILTIARDGYASDVPGFALMEEQKAIDETKVYLRIRSKDYNGADWVREVLLIKGLCVVFHDTVIADKEGEYVIGAHFRTPAYACLEGNTMKSKRKDKAENEYELRLTGYGSHNINVNLDEIPYGKRLFSYGGMYNNNEKDPLGNEKSVWKSRYNNDDIVISRMTTVSSTHLDKGEKICFTHVVQPAKVNDGEISVDILNNVLNLKYSDNTYKFPLEHTAKKTSKQNKIETVSRKQFKKEFSLKADIKNMEYISGDMYACALKNGILTLEDNGKCLWDKSLQGEIHDVEYVEPNMIVVGHGNNKLTALDLEGNILWEVKAKRVPTLFASWELPYPKFVKIKHIENEDGTVIVTGCGDNQIRTYNKKGEILNVFYIYATVPDALEIVDIDKDGKLEILAAGKTESSSGTFYVHDVKGNPKKNISVSGWLCNIRAHKLFYDDGKYTLVCGMNYSKNFKIMNISNGNIRTVCEKSLGGTVKSIALSNDNKIYAGTSKGSILAFDKKGKHIFHTYVKDSIKELFIKNNKITVICDSGKVKVLTLKGNIVSEGSLPSKPVLSVVTDKRVLIASGKSVYSLTD